MNSMGLNGKRIINLVRMRMEKSWQREADVWALVKRQCAYCAALGIDLA